MLDNRELAAVIWLLVFLAWMLFYPSVRLSLQGVGQAFLSPKIFVSSAALILWVALLVVSLDWAGLWRSQFIGDTVIWFFGTAVVLFFSLSGPTDRPGFFSRAAVSALKVGVFLAFFLNFFVLPLIVELVLQPILAILFLVSIHTEGRSEYDQARGCVNALLGLAGFVFLAYSIYRLVLEWGEIDLSSAWQRALLPVLLTLGTLPLIYILAVYASYDRAFGWIAFSKPSLGARIRAMVALALGLRLRRWEVSLFNAYWARRTVEAATFRAAREVIREFRADLAQTAGQEEQALERLERFAGVAGTDEAGRQLDRREFEETQKGLRSLAVAQMGWHRNHGRYRQELSATPGWGFELAALPDPHGLELHVSEDGHSWYAWRRAITGWCLGIGASGPPTDQSLFEGPEAPRGFPGEDEGWDPWGLNLVDW